MKKFLTILFLALHCYCYGQTVQIKGVVFLMKNPNDGISDKYLYPGDTVKLIQRYDNSLKVEHKGTIGFVRNGSFEENEDYKSFMANNKPIKFIEPKATPTGKTSYNDRLKKLIQKYGNSMGTIVAKREVRLGMTKAMVIDSWGQPKDINRTVGSWGVHEQWVYGDRTYLYFENGKLTSWQD